jgi:hypothetical protein
MHLFFSANRGYICFCQILVEFNFDFFLVHAECFGDSSGEVNRVGMGKREFWSFTIRVHKGRCAGRVDVGDQVRALSQIRRSVGGEGDERKAIAARFQRFFGVLAGSKQPQGRKAARLSVASRRMPPLGITPPCEPTAGT